MTEPCLAMVVDPEAASTCVESGVGTQVSLRLGHKRDPAWGDPINVTGKVLRISDGRFQYSGGFLGGRWTNMGPSAVLGIGSVQVLISSYPTYDWADEQYRSVGMQPEKAKFVGVKNMMNFRFGYGGIMKGYFVLDLTGPTPPDIRTMKLQRVSRPLFPLDDPTDPEIQISTSWSG